jgi:hypothetical protein
VVGRLVEQQDRRPREQRAGQQPRDLAERGSEQSVDREVGARRLLRQLADSVPRPERDAPAAWSLDTGEQAHQRRLAGAVPPDEADVARVPGSVRLSPSKIVLSPYSACRSEAVSTWSSVSRGRRAPAAVMD